MTINPSKTSHAGLKAVAMFEALKGLLVLLAGFGPLALVHHDVQAFVERIVVHLHLNPAHHYPRVFIEAAGRLTDVRLWLLAAGAFAYSLLRFAEAYGLWRERAWAEWIGIVSGGVNLPVEVYELVHRPTVLKARPADCQRRDCGLFVFYQIPSFQWFTATILIIHAG